ncbi:hypothetical protein GF362_04145 [Candidatus Dojkabacteria bacterium]|nr:hypothetical protein [Candidatus Dojkabacteria bacterium]
MRNRKTVEGDYCKTCIKKLYWKVNTPNLIGWAGTISLVLAPIFFISNTIQYLSSLGLDDVPEGAQKPKLKKEEINKISKFSKEVIELYRKTKSVSETANELAPKVGVAPEKIALYIDMVLRLAAAKRKKK